MTHRQRTRAIQKAVGASPDGIWGPQSSRLVYAALMRGDKAPELKPDGVSGELDARTRKNLLTLEPEAQRIFLPFIRQAQAIAGARGCDYIAISGRRTKKQQDALYAKGRTKPGPKVTNARWPNSNHNGGIALDFGVFKGRRYLDSQDPSTARKIHKAVAELLDDHPQIQWGGNWRSFKDLPHFEIDSGLSLAERRRRIRAGELILA